MNITISELAKMNVPDMHGLFPKKNMAKCAWHALRGTLPLWTPRYIFWFAKFVNL